MGSIDMIVDSTRSMINVKHRGAISMMMEQEFLDNLTSSIH